MEQNRTGHGKFKPLELEAELERQNKELLRTQQELMKSKICFTELYDSAPVGYFTLDLRGTILNANLTFAGMLSMDRSSLLNQNIMNYIVFEDYGIYYRHLKDLDALKMRQACELRMQTKDGAFFNVQLETILIADRCKEPKQYRTVVIDISARKKAEKEKEKLQAKIHQGHKMTSIGVIAGGIAHHFNNILQIISGNVELALDEIPKFNPAYTNLKRIKSAAQRASDMVQQLIDFYHKTNKNLKPIDIVDIIKKFLESLQPLIPATIELKTHFPNKDVTMLADRTQIDQALKNICINASQAMEGIGGLLEIKVETKHLTYMDIDNFSDLTPGEYIKITIRDTGPGIHPAVINQIFDPYFTTRGFENGSGMGLAIVYSIVKNHDGNIIVDSQPGKGTIFTLLFPLIAQKA